MATVTAFIRTQKTDKNKPVNVRFRLRDGRSFQLFHKSELSVIPEKWDEKQQKIKARCIFTEQERKTFDTAVNDRKALIKNVYLSKGKTMTSELLDAEISMALHPEKYETKPEITTLFQFIQKFVSEAHLRKDKNTGRPITHNNIQQYRATERHLKDFAKKIRKSDFDFAEIDQVFYNQFTEYLQSEISIIEKDTSNENGYKKKILKESFTQNSVGKHIRVLKLILNEATTQGYNTTTYYTGFHVFTEDTDTVYLNETELQQLKEADFPKTPHLDRVRDWFLLLAWTGSRFSDLEKVTQSDIKDGFITFRQQKTNTKVVIPLHPVVTEILEKYSFNMPEPISNQKFNEYIKEACKAAKITSAETMTRTVGGILVTEKFEKYERVSSHTGRRSFCTNMYKRGLPTLMIMSISGHKTETSFLKYIKVKQSEHAEMMKNEWAKIYQ